MKSWKITPLGSGGLLLIEPPVYQDERGEFFESWNERTFAGLGIPVRFVQDNQSLSLRRGTLRGIHFQTGEFAQAKLIRCTSGAIQDAAVDLRKKSPDYLRVYTVDLSADDARMLFIPRGSGMGFLRLRTTRSFSTRRTHSMNRVRKGASDGMIPFSASTGNCPKA